MSNQDYSPPVQNSTTALVSLIAGIAGWSIFPFFGSIIAVITGHMAKKEIRESGGRIGGETMATIGLGLGYSLLALGLLGGCIAVAATLFGVSLPFCIIPFLNETGMVLPHLFGI